MLPADAHATGFGVMTTASLVGLAVSPIVAGFISGPGLRMVFDADIVLLVLLAAAVWLRMSGNRHSSADGGFRYFCFLIGRLLLSSCAPPVWRGSGARGRRGLRRGRARRAIRAL